MSDGIFSFISNFLKRIESSEPVDISLGRLKIDNVTAKAQLIAEEKDWFNYPKSIVKSETYLVKYEFSKKLVWFVYFLHTRKLAN